MPMPPSTIRSLGATAPSRPRAELGMMVGAITAAPAAESAVFKNRRRGTCTASLDTASVDTEILDTALFDTALFDAALFDAAFICIAALPTVMITGPIGRPALALHRMPTVYPRARLRST